MVIMNVEAKTIQLSGILDSVSGNQLRQDISDLIERGTSLVKLNFTDVEFMDSSGLGALVVSLKRVREADGRLILCAINDQVRMILELTNLDNAFEILSGEDEFHQAEA
jgi:anti-anti-sigma factor